MIRMTLDCVRPDVLNDVFAAGLPGLVSVYQQWSSRSLQYARASVCDLRLLSVFSVSRVFFNKHRTCI